MLFCLCCSACPVLTVLFCLSRSGRGVCLSLLPVMLCLSCSECPILSVLFWISCFVCPFLGILFCNPVLSVLSWLPVSFCLWRSAFGVLPVPFCLPCCLPCCLSCSPCPVLPVLFYLSCSSCTVQDVMFCLFRSGCPALPVPFWMSCSALPFLSYLCLSWLSSHCYICINKYASARKETGSMQVHA